MNGIARFFLRAKHWQVFVLLVCTQLAEFVAWIATELTAGPSHGLLISMLIGEAATVTYCLCLVGWWWSMGSLLHSMVKPTRELNITLFRVSCIVFLLLCGILAPLSRLTDDPRLLIAAIGPMLLLFLFSGFYIPYFLSKSLVIKNRGRAALGSGEVAFFFLFLFSIVGVWLIQPRINQLYAEKKNAEPYEKQKATFR